jgi:hypothetical protein
VSRKIILYELNEVPFRVLDSFCTQDPDSSFARMLPRLKTYETLSEDKEPLSPWQTWPSLHRGVSDERHGIHDFGQDLSKVDRHYPPIWALLSAGKVRTGVCGSLHSYPMPATSKDYAFYLPDPFAVTPESIPPWLEKFQKFNLTMSRESGRNVCSKIHLNLALPVLANIRKIGLRLETLAQITGQLTGELLHRWKKTRRRIYQSALVFDVFSKLLEDTQPEFATFFTNHVAATMHRYWAASFPDDYESNSYSEEWIHRYRGEIYLAMTMADRFFNRLVRFVERHSRYALWVATSMGQAAAAGSPVRTELHLTHVARFMGFFGLGTEAWTRLPAMAPEVNLRLLPAQADSFEASLRQLMIHDRPLNFRRDAAFFSLTFGHKNLDTERQLAKFGNRCVRFSELGLTCTEIEDGAGSTGYHVRNGMLLIYDPARPDPTNENRQQRSNLDIAPAILRNYALPVPVYMRPGLSLDYR